ncbi:cytochrome c peroxidase [Polaribacter sp.]|uniref:cytochrome c peroxidase n=1 Tax=Polaribacter sp. TaxID=1920175 RepID=UPI003F6D968D
MNNKAPHTFALIGLAFILISGTIDLDNLFNYANQTKPIYIVKDNTPQNNVINDKTATLGRVLFYDKKLSANNTIACASCHQQENAFGDDATQSIGLDGGLTGRHSMRLINARFSDEEKFFWDERAVSLENQTTQPIQDHTEMGFSGTNGQEDINDLIVKLSEIDYYSELFNFAFGDKTITEERIQLALSQFIRSIQSFDSKYDIGRAMVTNPNTNFPNFTAQENQGKRLFRDPPNLGGAGCLGCHRGDEFDIDPNSRNNGIIGVAGSTSIDLTNFKAPTLRDLVNPDGNLNGPLMHDGSLTTLMEVINHYNEIPNNAANTDLDNRLRPGGNTQRLNLTNTEKLALEAFLKTLTGVDVYTNEKWSNPFDANENISLIGNSLATDDHKFGQTVTLFPNPVKEHLNIKVNTGDYLVTIFDLNGKKVFEQNISESDAMNLYRLRKGIYFLKLQNLDSKKIITKKFIKQ